MTRWWVVASALDEDGLEITVRDADPCAYPEARTELQIVGLPRSLAKDIREGEEIELTFLDVLGGEQGRVRAQGEIGFIAERTVTPPPCFESVQLDLVLS